MVIRGHLTCAPTSEAPTACPGTVAIDGACHPRGTAEPLQCEGSSSSCIASAASSAAAEGGRVGAPRVEAEPAAPRAPTHLMCSVVETHLRAQSVAISVNQWQSVAISGNQWQSVVISGHQRMCSTHLRAQSAVISGHQRSSAVISGHQWPSAVISGHQWPSAVISGPHLPRGLMKSEPLITRVTKVSPRERWHCPPSNEPMSSEALATAPAHLPALPALASWSAIGACS